MVEQMNKIFLILIIVGITLNAQVKNKIMQDVKSGKPILVGICDREAFADSNFTLWFNKAYNSYLPETQIVDSLLKFENNFTLTIVMGTWCSDSRREVPHFYKLLDLLKFPEEKVTLINVDRKKDGIDIDIFNLKIELVPTFIVYNNNVEIGRIIETPINLLESDLLQILKNVNTNR
jgi:thiol-disulfide isomerase/thioredoxin